MRLKSPGDEPVKVGLLSGHIINIPPEGREVPQRFIKEAFQAGCLPAEVDSKKVGGQKDDEPTGKERQELIVDAIKAMLESGANMTTEGMPNLKQLSKDVGFTVNRKEMIDAWNILEDLSKQDEGGDADTQPDEVGGGNPPPTGDLK